MASGLDRRVLAALLAGSVLVLALVLVARGNAGNGSTDTAIFKTFAAPSQLTAGSTGFVRAKFTPVGTGNSGSATHVVISFTFPSGTTDTKVTTCPGTPSADGLNPATCTIGTVHNGDQVTMDATYKAGPTAGSPTINESVGWDVAKTGGSTGGHNVKPSSNPIEINTDGTFAGTCSPLSNSSSSLNAGAPGVHKSIVLDFGQVDSSLSFPCTPAQAGVDSSVDGPTTPGSWTLLVAPLAGGAFAQAHLTIDTLPRGIKWNNAQLFEVGVSTPVPPCASATSPPTTGDACLANQIKSGSSGVEFIVNVLGTGIDPSFTS
jgi:hypothetical protein